MKRIMTLVLCLLMAVACVACGSQPAANTTTVPAPAAASEPPTPPSEEPVTITYWNLTMTDMPFEADLIANFEAAYPNIKVEVVQVPVENFHDKLILAAQTNTLPDVAQGIPEWTADMIEAGVLKDITADINDVKSIYGSAIGLCAWDGNFYALPFRFGTSGIFVNRAVVESAGVEVPESWTWAEFCDVARALTDPKKGVYGFGIPGAATGDLGLSWDYLTFALANGSGFIKDNKADFSNDASAEALTEICKLMTEGVLPESTVSFTAADVVDAFGAGKVAMFMNGPWYAATVKASYPDLDFFTVQLPVWKEDAESFSVNGGTYLSPCSTTKHYEEALAFIKYMTSEDTMRVWASKGEFIPAVASLMDDAAFTSGLMAPFAYQAKRPSTTIAATVENTNLMEILQTEIDHALLGEKLPAEALADAAAQWDEILANHS